MRSDYEIAQAATPRSVTTYSPSRPRIRTRCPRPSPISSRSFETAITFIPGSLSDDARLRGRPRDFDITVRSIQINAGAGFLVVLTGDILRMPGMPARPLAESIDVRDGRIVGPD